MHLSDDEFEILHRYHMVTYRPKKSLRMDTRIQTIGFGIVFIVLVIIFTDSDLLETSRIRTPYNKTFFQYINNSLYERRRFRMQLIKNLSVGISNHSDVTLSLKNLRPGLIEASDSLGEMVQDALFEPMLKLIVNRNFSKEFYKASHSKVFYDGHPLNIDLLIKHNPYSKHICTGRDWVSCDGFHCKVNEEILDRMPTISCYYKNIVYTSNNNYHIGTSFRVNGNATYYFKESDHVKVFCNQSKKSSLSFNFHEDEYWIGVKTGFRPVFVSGPRDRQNAPNVLILVLDSIPYNKFYNYLPIAYKILTQEFRAVKLESYNVNNSGMVTVFDILMKKVGFKFQDEQKPNRNIYLYPDNFLIERLHDYGYYTAYFTDLPMVSSNNTKFQTDYKLNNFFEENEKIARSSPNTKLNDTNCVGDTSKYALLLKKVLEYTQIASKSFSFTLISNITAYPPWEMEDKLVFFLRSLRDKLDDTLFILMTSQIFSKAPQSTPNAEDLDQLVFIVLPRTLVVKKPETWHNLMSNSYISTTPFDIDTTIMAVVGLDYLSNNDNVTDSKQTKGRNLLKLQFQVSQHATWNPLPPTL